MPGKIPWTIYGSIEYTLYLKVMNDGQFMSMSIDPGQQNLAVTVSVGQLGQPRRRIYYYDHSDLKDPNVMRKFAIDILQNFIQQGLSVLIVERQPDKKVVNVRTAETFMGIARGFGLTVIEINCRRKSIELGMPKDLTGTAMKNWICHKAVELENSFGNFGSATHIQHMINTNQRVHDISVTICQEAAFLISLFNELKPKKGSPRVKITYLYNQLPVQWTPNT